MEAVFDGSSGPRPKVVIVALQLCPYVDDFALHSIHGPQSYRLRYLHSDGDREVFAEAADAADSNISRTMTATADA